LAVRRGKKLKKKSWFTIIAPSYFKHIPLGLTMASEPKYVLGRVVEASAMTLTNDYSKYYMKFKFKVNKVEGDKAFTVFDGVECLQDYISRLIRRRVRRIDVIQDVTTKDGITLRVKSLAVSNRIIKSSVKKSLRDFIKEIVHQEISGSTVQQVIEKIVSDTIKKRILKEGSKIYPLRYFEIRRIDVISSGEKG